MSHLLNFFCEASENGESKNAFCELREKKHIFI